MRIVWFFVSIGICVLTITASSLYVHNVTIYNVLDGPITETAIPWGQISLQSVFLLAGVCFGHLHKRFNDLKRQGTEHVSLLAELRLMLTAIDFLIALTAAPIVYGAVIAATRQETTFTALILAFQNGFFWKAIFSSTKEAPTSPQPTSQGPTAS